MNAPQSGTIVETLANEEDTVTVGQDLFKIEPGEAPAEGASSEGEEAKDDKPSQDEEQSAKKDEESKQAKEKEQSKEKEQNKEKEAKEQQESKKSATKEADKSGDRKPASQPPKKDQSASPPAPPATPGSRVERRVKMSRMRLRIAERLKQSQNTAASLTTFNEVDMSALMAFRARHKERILKEQGVKLGFMGAFAKASAMALKEIPAANASIEGEGLGDTIVYRDYVDLSVAVSTEKGLVTPVVRNVEALSILGIEREIAELGKKVRGRWV